MCITDRIWNLWKYKIIDKYRYFYGHAFRKVLTASVYYVRNMPKVFTSKNQKNGELGEGIAVKYLQGKGYRILERNYTRKCGEIDIVAQKGGRILCIEVKSRLVRSFNAKAMLTVNPAENMHGKKQQRFRAVIAEYLTEHKVGSNWRADVILVYINSAARIARVHHIQNVIL